MFISTVNLEMSGRLAAVLGKEVFCPHYILIFFNDVIKRTLEVKACCKLVAKSYSVIAYADDIVLIAPSKTRAALIRPL